VASDGIPSSQPSAIIPNDKLLDLDVNRTAADAFRQADSVLSTSVRGITEIIQVSGRINVDFADVRTTLAGAGPCVMGQGEGRGERRALEATQAAVCSPFLEENTLRGATRVLVNFIGGSNMKLSEIHPPRTEHGRLTAMLPGRSFDFELDGELEAKGHRGFLARDRTTPNQEERMKSTLIAVAVVFGLAGIVIAESDASADQTQSQLSSKSCSFNSDCSHGVCRDGECGGCSFNSECNGWGMCKDGHCGACSFSSECEGFGECSGGRCSESPY